MMFPDLKAMRGIKRNLLAFVLGVCATLTLAPCFIFPLIIPAYGGLLLLVLNAPNKKRAFADGWWWGWGFYMTGLYWFCIALMTDPEKFAWLLPFALFGLTAVIALYQGVACWLFYQVKKPGWHGALYFALIWTAVEYLRGHWLGNFPWNLAGYAFGVSDASIQLASVIGIYGLTFFTLLLGAVWVANKRAIIMVWACFALSIAFGVWRLQEPTPYVDGVRLRLVQANIQQHHKWNPAMQIQGLRAHVDLTQSEGIERITHVIWPETAVPYVLRKDSVLAARLGEILPPGTHLITGALSAEGEGAAADIFNSIIMLDHKGEQLGRYDKHMLVPFGEFLPFRRFIPPTWQTPVGMKDMGAGKGPQTLSWQGLPPVSALICYEVIFPNEAVAAGEHRPTWLLSITNDAWFGHSSGPYQHLEMARMRSVEQGLPLVRVANTGITAVYDGLGRKISEIPLGAKGVIDVDLPHTSKNRTIYGRYF